MTNISNIVLDPESFTVTYNLKGDRNEDQSKVLTKVFSAHDSKALQTAIQAAVNYYQDYVEDPDILDSISQKEG